MMKHGSHKSWRAWTTIATVSALLAVSVPAHQYQARVPNTFHSLNVAALFQEPQPKAIVFSDNFETNLGWSRNPAGTDTATTGLWERGDPEPTSSNGVSMQLGNTVSGANALVTGRLAGTSVGSNDIDGGITSIQSPAITLPSGQTLTLSFSFYLAHLANATSDDFFRTTIIGSSNSVFQVAGAAVIRGAVWTTQSINISSFAGQTIRIRFEAADNAGGSLVEAAVDDVSVTSSDVGLAANLALNHPATGSTPCNANEGPAKAVNGTVSGGNSDKWCSHAATKFLRVDLGANFTVNQFVVKHAGAGGESTALNTRDFNIETSTDGTSFTRVVTVTGNTASTTTHPITARTARFVRLNITAPEQGTGDGARIYELEVYPPFPSPAPPASLQDYISNHAITMTRVAMDDHVAVYFDPSVSRGSDTAWIFPQVSQFWQYFRRTYGHFGPDRLRSFSHEDRFFGGTISNYFDAFSGFNNTIDVGDNGWSQNNDILRDELAHEMCHVVEGANNGIHESPAFTVWGDSKWAEFCTYDLYVGLGRQADADRAFNRFMGMRDNFPRPNTAWFRDWFFPLWRDHGRAQVMVKFFQLVAQNFPKHLENNGRNFIYDRRMNLGEFIHFSSGAAGTNLSSLATTAFGTGWESQFQQARTDFPTVTQLY